MNQPAMQKDSPQPKCSPAYVKFVQQSRKVLGLPEKPDPTKRLNPSFHGLMKKVLYGQKKTSPKRTI
jgi:hypothetical protein